IDSRSDIYSLGTLLYESILGEPPFAGTTQTILYRIANERPPSLRARGAMIQEDLEKIIMQCLEKDPDRRPQRAEEVAEALARQRRIRILHARFVEQDRSFPYQGFCEAIQEYFRTRSTTTSQLAVDFSDLAPDLAALFPVLTEIEEIRSTTSGTKLTNADEPRK